MANEGSNGRVPARRTENNEQDDRVSRRAVENPDNSVAATIILLDKEKVISPSSKSASGLEKSRSPFMWAESSSVVRKPLGFTCDGRKTRLFATPSTAHFRSRSQVTIDEPGSGYGRTSNTRGLP